MTRRTKQERWPAADVSRYPGIKIIVLNRLRRGVSDKDIALELGLTIWGVQYHKPVFKRVRGLPPGPTDSSVVKGRLGVD